MARAWAAAHLRPILKSCFTGSLIGVTIADRYVSLTTVNGESMYPTFDPKPAEHVLVEKLCLDRYNFSRGDVVVLRSPSDHRVLMVKRLIALPGDWIQVSEKQEIRQIPEGHCWVEGDNTSVSWDSRECGPVPLGLMHGRVTHVIWPPNRIGRVDRKMPEGRIMPRQ